MRRSGRFQLFQDRGISLDTNLWPDFLIDQHLANMLRKGLLSPGCVHRVAVVGPGLDFANKEKLEQALARLNMALMLNPAGFALSNDRLPGSAAHGFADSLETTQIFARNPDRTEYMFTYQRRR